MQTRGKPVVIKKYSNRRLYDTDDSRYITLDELAQKIRKGRDVRVVDASSEEDLTQVTLTQIILESGRAARLLPVHLLLQLIRMDDDELAEFFNRYMAWAMELYAQAKNSARALSPINPFANLPFAATSALARFFTGGPVWGGEQAPPPPINVVPQQPPPEPPPAAPKENGGGSDEVAELRRELRELKDAIRSKLRD
jgi:polyhydroxyalkanoate synthesis repressor PhaR